MPPSHKSEAIVSRYAPLIVAAVKAFPHVCIFEPTPDIAASTFFARFRDSMKALTEFDYPSIKIKPSVLGWLGELLAERQIKTRVVGGKLYVGSHDSIEAQLHKQVAGQLIGTELSDMVDTITTDSKEVIGALCVLILHGIIESATFSGLPIDKVRNLVADRIEATQLPGNTILIYEK